MPPPYYEILPLLGKSSALFTKKLAVTIRNGYIYASPYLSLYFKIQFNCKPTTSRQRSCKPCQQIPKTSQHILYQTFLIPTRLPVWHLTCCDGFPHLCGKVFPAPAEKMFANRFVDEINTSKDAFQHIQSYIFVVDLVQICDLCFFNYLKHANNSKIKNGCHIMTRKIRFVLPYETLGPLSHSSSKVRSSYYIYVICKIFQMKITPFSRCYTYSCWTEKISYERRPQVVKHRITHMHAA